LWEPFAAEDGQNWGFPTYNWDKMAENGYLWWRQRLTQMAKYFHAFRIDHILGFFRIWEIPVEFESGLMGSYNFTVISRKIDGLASPARFWREN
jgi:4-alpha-glucanotransferase